MTSYEKVVGDRMCINNKTTVDILMATPTPVCDECPRLCQVPSRSSKTDFVLGLSNLLASSARVRKFVIIDFT